MVEWLVDHNADIFIDNSYVLRIAIKNGNLDIVKCLVENGADIHANNDAAIRIAKSYNRTKISEYFDELIRFERE
jgi:ankyrin repeat protein